MYKSVRKRHGRDGHQEYSKALREQHNLKHNSHEIQISKGDVVLRVTRRIEENGIQK